MQLFKVPPGQRANVIIRLLTVCVLITVPFIGIHFVTSGQTVCQGSPEEPCYKIAYFRDVSSRVAFWEAQDACEMDGGSLLSIENTAEQKHIEHLLGSGITDGDFWIGMTRVEDETAQEPGSFASCPNLYRWTDGSVSQFR
uniref:Chondrolectin n=1 Tax=Sinocyclocheilus rhinocerous TaxID=307959 RepID=A0A673FUS1_9TELE